MEFSDLWDVQFSKPVTAAIQKTGGVEVLHDRDKDKAVLLCNTSDTTFGPLITDSYTHHAAYDAGEAARRFLQWHQDTYGDPRSAKPGELDARLAEFGEKFHRFTNYYSSEKGQCTDCGLPAEAHAENKPCPDCNGTGAHPNPDPQDAADWAPDPYPCDSCSGTGKPDFDEGGAHEFAVENDQPER